MATRLRSIGLSPAAKGLDAFPFRLPFVRKFREVRLRRAAYDKFEHVSLTRDFLNNPEAFLRHL